MITRLSATLIASLVFTGGANAQSGSLPATQPRIVGGGAIVIDQTPSIVALLNKEQLSLGANYRESQFCGGSLVASSWVLTAAHCVYGADDQRTLPGTISVLIGSADLTRPEADPINVVEVITHPLYISNLVLQEGQDQLIQAAWRPDSDIALLRLETPSEQTPILIDATPIESDELGYVAGWGALSDGSTEVVRFPDILQGAIVTSYSSEVCGNRYPDIFPFLGRGVICASRDDSDIDTCQGDSGGPLYSLSIMSGRLYNLSGITSWGIGCASGLSPGVYTDVAHYLDWIGGHVPEVGVSNVDSSRREEDLLPALDGLYETVDDDAPLSTLSALGSGSLGGFGVACLGIFYIQRRRQATATISS